MRRPKAAPLTENDSARVTDWASPDAALAEKTVGTALASRTLRNVALFLAVALVAKSLADVTWRVLAPSASATPLVGPLGEQRVASVDVPSVFAAHFFGDRTVPPHLSGSREGSMTASDLGITLIGVVAAGRDSIALVSISGRPAEPFTLGREIIKGAVLDRVEPDRIVIRRGGRLETILLSGAPGAPAPKSVGGVASLGANRYAVSRDAVRAELASPEALMQASVSSASGGGLSIDGVEAGSIYEQLGLKSGTVIHSVNGKQVTNPQDLLTLYQQLGASNEIQLDVTIDGQQEKLRYDVK